jgi:zinc protease
VLLTEHTATHPAVTVYATLDAGNLHDPDSSLGLANFVARVIDRGTESRSPDEIAEALDGRGVSLTTGVTRHLLSLSCTCLSETSRPIMSLVADVIRRPSFPCRPGREAPDGHRHGSPPGSGQPRGCRDRRADGAVVRRWPSIRQGGSRDGRRRSRPSAAPTSSPSIVVVQRRTGSGWSSSATSSRREWKISSTAPSATGAPRRQERWFSSAVSPASGGRETRHAIPGKPQADIAYGFTTITRDDPRYYALTLMNNVLGQYALGGRLGDNIRERQGMAYYVFSSFDANVAEGPLVVRAGVSPGQRRSHAHSHQRGNRKMGRDGVTVEELADSCRYLVGSMPRVLETNAGIASFLHNAEYFGLGLDFDRRLPGLLERVTLDEVNEDGRRLSSHRIAPRSP